MPSFHTGTLSRRRQSAMMVRPRSKIDANVRVTGSSSHSQCISTHTLVCQASPFTTSSGKVPRGASVALPYSNRNRLVIAVATCSSRYAILKKLELPPAYTVRTVANGLRLSGSHSSPCSRSNSLALKKCSVRVVAMADAIFLLCR